jgi:hypothetical protein
VTYGSLKEAYLVVRVRKTSRMQYSMFERQH